MHGSTMVFAIKDVARVFTDSVGEESAPTVMLCSGVLYTLLDKCWLCGSSTMSAVVKLSAQSLGASRK